MSVDDEVFVDSGAWIALGVVRDGQHAVARAHLKRLLSGRCRLVTTNLVVAESYALIRQRGGHPAAMTFLRSLRASPRLDHVTSDADIELAAEKLLRQFADQDFSYVDAVSFVVMRRRRIETAFAFDRHFRTAGFRLVADTV